MNIYGMKAKVILLIIIHIFIALAIYAVPILSKVYASLLALISFVLVFVAKDWKTLLYWTAYITAAEVFTRMSRGLFFYEIHKYLSALLFVGIIFRTGLRWVSLPYLFYLILLLPGVLYTWWLESLDPSYIGLHLRKDILFNIAGPITLGLGAMALLNLKMNFKAFKNLLLAMLLPVITTTVYVIVKTPSLKDIIFTTQANFATSGGFGPNQVATILGLGMFTAFVLFILEKDFVLKMVYLFFFVLISYRSFLTFSRGGTLTGIVMIIVFLGISLISKHHFFKVKNLGAIFLTSIIIGGVFYYASEITRGMLLNRFTGRNTAGQMKEDVTSGRITIFLAEIKGFVENPVWGTGVGRAKIERKKEIGIKAATHNEISRLISEHGIFGVLALLILIFVPLMQGLIHKNNIFFYPFFLFWLLTIFHSSMRLAAPGVLYALSLIQLSNEKNRLYRE